MRKLLCLSLIITFFSCQKKTEKIFDKELRSQISNSIQEVKLVLDEFNALKKSGSINSDYKSTSDQLFYFLENSYVAKNSYMSFDKPVSILNKSFDNSSEQLFSSDQSSSYIDFSQFSYFPRTEVGNHIVSFISEYEKEIDNLAVDANIEGLNVSQFTDSLNEISSGIKQEIFETPTLTNEEKEMLLGVFEGVQTLTPSMLEYFQLEGATSNFSFNELETFSNRCGLFCKIGRAVLRVAVAVVTVATIAVVPVSAIAIAKKASFILAYKTFMLKGYSIGTVLGIPAKLKAGLIGGLYFGIKSAEKGWDKDWKGWPYEFTLGLYVKSEV